MTGRIYVCDVCKRPGVWSAEHMWYGRLSDIDGGALNRRPRPIVITCSGPCRAAAAAMRLVPPDAEHFAA